ncbi:Sodium/calcium exchanger protein-domain-containing protein [Bisporella sp. PMI_857]|nr:Sodium/calcium exchanger protein-domain-containing protein [Bisporella sp. PMI_857]
MIEVCVILISWGLELTTPRLPHSISTDSSVYMPSLRWVGIPWQKLYLRLSHSLNNRIRSWARTKAHGPSPLRTSSGRQTSLPVTNQDTQSANNNHNNNNNGTSTFPPFPSNDLPGFAGHASRTTGNNVVDNTSPEHPEPAPPPQVDGQGAVIKQQDNKDNNKKKNIAVRFWYTSKSIILSSYVNILLVFVPVGIASKAAHLSPGIVFGMNAIAIIPLAGLLSHATESVAKRMGDTVGALMNVTFGNAVELIIFIIALQDNQIRIVQASLLGSILANLLLILGMCFLIGGLKFREQLYNSTVTQMSACLLSLAVMSLLLPTAFHASFNTEKKDNAESAVLKVSRGTSVILLLVYVLYLVFQLKSHAYMYESTPQHIIDEEAAHPGPVAEWLDTSSSDDSSSSSSDSDGSSGSNTTAKRFKRVMRGGRRRRKSSAGSKDTAENPEKPRTPSIGTSSITPRHTEVFADEPATIDAADHAGDEADDENQEKKHRRGSIISHLSKRDKKKIRKHKEKRERKARRNGDDTLTEGVVAGSSNEKDVVEDPSAPRRVDFAVGDNTATPLVTEPSAKRPFTLRGITNFAPPVFQAPAPTGSPAPPAGPVPRGSVPRVKYGIRRTNSLPDRLNQTPSHSARPVVTNHQQTSATSHAIVENAEPVDEEEENISRTTAVILLLVSTGLVALCADFLVESINDVVETSPLSETFVGLIILPIVGNAAEHVTAVVVASKNKMDLAIGVAVGSSIQIALFVTPFIVLLGWAMGKDMSLYFTLFETVSLFVSAFIVNFLVLDGRSNYLEGSLLCSAYVCPSLLLPSLPVIRGRKY